MGGGGSLFSTIINPIGALAKSIGGVGGVLLDPVGSFARSQPQGSTLGWLADPVSSYTQMLDTKPEVQEYKPQEVLSYEERMKSAKERLKRQSSASAVQVKSPSQSIFKEDEKFSSPFVGGL